MQFKIIRMYADNNGISHFQDMPPYEMKEYPPIFVSGLMGSPFIPAVGFLLEIFPADFFMDWHLPPDGHRYAGIFIEGSMRFVVGDGTEKIVTAGDVLFYEDTTGQGHRTYGVTAGKEIIIRLD